ncbi:asparagine synthase (glutamine-hydrolyzing) [Nitrococcus mobilis]|uniref:asparagine synthase (glutamine-hydrolyzing) n=1 Tax=Nitrococcus mobilis Nb-231 TaxID=314278 RepID=A4BL90_9GAMM|nr:asparagine synthase (glutamine-hydrolyzing) [Nitrococcus mobilis]EAR23078.1 asparagine synthetase, glutamine-hydrolyzing [Nitrococcus mobilis Nb-231]
MCGIAGVYLRSGEPNPEALSQAARRLGHRGPDAQGFWCGARVGLAHRRLSVIDLAGGQQPMASQDGALQLVANGEIYNFVELRQRLQAVGHRFTTRSDVETILHAYAEYGLEFVRHLHGMFAFALYDRVRDRLILARDRLGLKPLYLGCAAAGVAFASELKGLLPLLGKRPEVDPVALIQYLQNQFSSGPRTILAGVERVCPGELVVIEAGRISQRRHYWSATEVATSETSFAEASRRFDELFVQVMTEHMRSDVPFGLFLSGGVDSSVLLAMLSRLQDRPIATYSVGFDAPGMVNELPDAACIARRYGSRHHGYAPSKEVLLGLLPRAVWASDDLMRDYANLPVLYLARRAARELKVVFSGEGGDEVFAGYGRYRVNRLERWLKAMRYRGTGGFRTSAMLRGRAVGGLLGTALWAVRQEARRPFMEAWQAAPSHWSDLQRMQYVDLTTALPDNLLVKADRMLMACGVEGRLPLVDHRIVEFGLALPDRLKVQGSQGKYFLKRWAERLVDRTVLHAPKRGFHVPVRRCFDGHLDWLQRRLPAHPAVRGWFRPRGVAALLARDAARGQLGRPGFALVQFALWHRLLLDGEGHDPGFHVDPFELLS